MNIQLAIDPKGKFHQIEDMAIAYLLKDKDVKARIDQLFTELNYSHNTIDALAVILRIDQLTKLEKMQESNEARQYIVCRQLEEALAARPQYNADNVDREVPTTTQINKKVSDI